MFLVFVFIFSTAYVISALDSVKAASNNWDFTTAGDYTYDSDKIEFSGGVAQLKQDWYDAGYTNRKTITIDRAKVSTDNQVNFPVLINTTDGDLKDTTAGGDVGQSDGGDIVFVNTDNATKLDFEKESYTSTTGALIYWVEVPNVNGSGATTDTVIYMYYGSSTAADQWSAEATWDSNFVLVQHMNEDPSGDAPQMIDSTSNSYDGTSVGTMTNGDLIAGQIGNGLDFDGGNDGVTIPHNSDFDLVAPFAYSFWVNSASTPNLQEVLGHNKDASAYTGWSAEVVRTSGVDYFRTTAQGNEISSTANSSIPEDTLIYIAVSKPSSGASYDIYVNGVEETSYTTDLTTNPSAYTIVLSIGKTSFNGAGRYFNGVIDEVRISDIARSDTWVAASYNNQKWPDKDDHGASGFYTVAAGSSAYPTDSPTVVNNTGLTFTKNLGSLSEILASDSAGSVTYQVSNDGTNWYYYDNSNWVSASGVGQSNAVTVLDTNLITFVDDVGTGDFYFKAFLTGDGSQQVKLSAVSVLYDTAGGGGSPDEVVVVEEVEDMDPGSESGMVEEEETAEDVVEEVVEDLIVDDAVKVVLNALKAENSDLKSEVFELKLLIQDLQSVIAFYHTEVEVVEDGLSELVVYGPYLNDFIRFGNGANDPEAILKLKTFLNEYEGESLDLEDLTYNQETFDAVLRFQEKYAEDILAPWNLTNGTGYVGETTVEKINEIVANQQ